MHGFFTCKKTSNNQAKDLPSYSFTSTSANSADQPAQASNCNNSKILLGLKLNTTFISQNGSIKCPQTQGTRSNPGQARVLLISSRTNTYKKDATRAFPSSMLFPHLPKFYRTLIAHIEIVFCLGKLPKRLSKHHVYTRQNSLPCLSNFDPFYLQFQFLQPSLMNLFIKTHKVNRTKMFHTIRNYLLVQHHVNRTKTLILITSRL